MQGNYQGTAPFLISPLEGARSAGYKVSFSEGTSISGTSTDGFAAALKAAKHADAIIFAGGIDESIEREGLDREDIEWPGVQLELVSRLSKLGKPLVVLQFGGGQIDGTALKRNKQVSLYGMRGEWLLTDIQVNALLWAGYPGQSGGTALADIISGRAAPAGRLPITQYPASYVDQVPMTDMTLRPSSNSPGRTYQWYNSSAVFEFGHGLHYTDFKLAWRTQPALTYSTSDVQSTTSGNKKIDLQIFDAYDVVVKNTGKVTSDYVVLLFLSGSRGPKPVPKKQLVGYTRLHQIKPGQSATASLKVTIGSLSRSDEKGNLWVHGGSYNLTVDTGVDGPTLSHAFEVKGKDVQISAWPQKK